MEDKYTILKKDYTENVLYIQLKDNINDFIFWIECGLIDGYGNRANYKTSELYIDWSYNQYIFYTDNAADIYAKEYQENGDNADAITHFIDNINDKLVKEFKNRCANQ